MNRAGKYIVHQLTAWNTTGENIHSPYLFDIVRHLFYRNDTRFYCWHEIENCRRQMKQSEQILDVVDYGTGTSGLRRVKDIARGSLESPKCGQLLFRLLVHLGNRVQRPLEIVELGTSLGITTAYLAMADSRNRVTTYEGSSAILDVARNNWRQLGIRNIEAHCGNIDNILGTHAYMCIDMAYMDANHTYEATMRYWEALAALAGEKSVYVVDDIHHSPEMERAWTEIQNREEVTTTMDFFHFGLVFFDRHYLKKHYKMRL